MWQRAVLPAQQLHSACARYSGSFGRLGPHWLGHPLRSLPLGTALAANTGPAAEVSPTTEHDAALSRLEAVLFLAKEPLNSRKLSQCANLADGTQARTLVRRLNERYDAAGRAFRVEQVAGGYQLLSRRKFAPWLRRLAHVPDEARLSAPALETLAVIAYRQPVPRADIEAVRGVNCGEILRQLMDRDLVRIGGRSAELGRPFLYATTKRFLQLFGLSTLAELPRGEELRALPLPAAPPKIPPPHDESPPVLESLDAAEYQSTTESDIESELAEG